MRLACIVIVLAITSAAPARAEDVPPTYVGDLGVGVGIIIGHPGDEIPSLGIQAAVRVGRMTGPRDGVDLALEIARFEPEIDDGSFDFTHYSVDATVLRALAGLRLHTGGSDATARRLLRVAFGPQLTLLDGSASYSGDEGIDTSDVSGQAFGVCLQATLAFLLGGEASAGFELAGNAVASFGDRVDIYDLGYAGFEVSARFVFHFGR
jgi:hypothetical protein